MTFRLAVLIGGLGFIISGCESNTFSQCSQLFQVAADVNQNNQELLATNVDASQESEELKNWLQAAQRMESAAAKIQMLEIDQGKLIEFQHQLATVYRIYAQATYDAVSARENYNRESLRSASGDAVAAGEMQQTLIRELNAYCIKSQT